MRKLSALILPAIMSFAAGPTLADQTGPDTPRVTIAKYRDNKKCAVSYTFDDGLAEHFTLVAPMMNKLNMKGTFVINGSKINEDSRSTQKDSSRMSWRDLRTMAKAGHEISNHGWAHKNFGRFSLAEIAEDILKNDSAIFARIGIVPRTFAYPNNTKTPEGVKLASKNRVGTRLFQRSIGGKATYENLSDWLEQLKRDEAWGVGMTHGITYGYDHFREPEILWRHFRDVKAKQDVIWVGTFREVSAYISERDSTSLVIKQTGRGKYVISPTCELDKEIYAENLTGILSIRGSATVRMCQGTKKLKTKGSPAGLLFNFNPYGAPIELTIRN